MYFKYNTTYYIIINFENNTLRQRWAWYKNRWTHYWYSIFAWGYVQDQPLYGAVNVGLVKAIVPTTSTIAKKITLVLLLNILLLNI